jgi:site-specific recombinase XerD
VADAHPGKQTTLTPTFAVLVTAFFAEHLPHQLGLSAKTVATYRDAFTLFIDFLRSRRLSSVENMALSELTPELITAFLDHLQHERGNSAHSRNTRLAALRTFLKFAAPWDLSSPSVVRRCLKIPMQRFDRPRPQALSHQQMLAVIGEPDGSWLGQRDHVLLNLLYNSGASAAEIVRVRVDDLVLERAPQVIIGPAERRRSVPLWPATVHSIRQWLKANPQLGAAVLLPEPNGAPMTPWLVKRRLSLAVAKAAARDPELGRLHISPRTVRHTAAMHLLHSGTDVGTVATWLGHKNAETLKTHVRALRATRAGHRTALRRRAPQSLAAFLRAL